MSTPHLEFPANESRPRAAVLVLHGGKAKSLEAVAPQQLTVRRMRPFARHLTTLGSDIAVVQLRYRVRGWNGTGSDVLSDVAFALDAIDEHYARVPIVILGHSMGGRAGLRAGGHPSVTGVVALAPWLPGDEPVVQLHGRDVVVLHGTQDRTTDPRASERYAARARPIAGRIVCLQVPRSGHGMVLRAATWHRLTTAFVAAEIDHTSFDGALRIADDAGCRPLA